MTPLITLVSGTYNRLGMLQGMIQSFRSQIPRHIDHEIIIVDGGSGDGTIPWLKSQSDIRPIFHDHLLGAIKAFCDGAEAAQGEYVLLANDDIVFKPFSVLRAVRYLEDHASTGAVAFADDRAAQLGHGRGHHVLQMPAVQENGIKVLVNYAQVGLFRKQLGEAAGWWGIHDEIMRAARTYGGDNFLSSRLWEMGYTVDAVHGCAVDDLISRDGVRRVNNSSGEKDSKLYYTRYPHGAVIPQVKKSVETNRLRIMVCPIYEPSFPGPMNLEYGLTEALAKKGLTWEIDYVNSPVDLVSAMSAWRPHLLLLQMHDAKAFSIDTLVRARQASPGTVIINWNGDAHESGLIAPDVLALLKHVDLQLCVNAKVLPVYAQHDIKADYWQIAFKDPVGELPVVPAHDVICLMNCYNDQRIALAKMLKELPYNVGLYGSCPDADGNTHYSFASSRALYQNAKIAVGDTFPDTEGFVSNRLFQALSAGVFLLQQHSPRLEEFTGLVPGRHYIEWTDLDDLRDEIEFWMTEGEPQRMDEIARLGRDYVRANFSYDAQIEKLWRLIP